MHGVRGNVLLCCGLGLFQFGKFGEIFLALEIHRTVQGRSNVRLRVKIGQENHVPVFVACICSRCIHTLVPHGFFVAGNMYGPFSVAFLVAMCVVLDMFPTMEAVCGGAIHPKFVHIVWKRKRCGIIRTSTYHTIGLVGVNCGRGV